MAEEADGSARVPAIRMRANTAMRRGAVSPPRQIWLDLSRPLAPKDNVLHAVDQLLYLVWLIRPDLQALFDLDGEAGVEGFIAWCAVHGAAEYPGLAEREVGRALELDSPPLALAGDEVTAGLISVFMRGVWRLRADLKNGFPLEDAAGRAGYVVWYLRNRGSELGLRHPLPARQAAALEEPWLPAPAADLLPLPRLSRLLWAARPDLQQLFDQSAAGLRAYRGWFLLNGFRELDWFSLASPDYITQAATPVAGGLTRLSLSLWAERPDLQVAFPLDLAGAPLAYADWLRANAEVEHGLPSRLCIAGILASPPTVNPISRPVPERGVNLVGYPRGDLGIGEDVRMAAASLSAAGIPFCILDLVAGHGISQSDRRLTESIVTEPRFDTNLFCLTAPEQARAVAVFGRDLVEGRRNIGYWPWELSMWPAEWDAFFALVDEIWVSSQHTRRALDIIAPIPVIYMPMAVTISGVAQVSRRDFGLPENSFLFVFAFDGSSHIARKNPLAVLDAFALAFPDGDEPVGLVIKAMRPSLHDPAWGRLLRQADADPRIHVITDTLGRGSILGLYRLCDCFVSLHRAEGFGRGLAEAMLLEKPVIATGWSGNLEFTRSDTAWLVGHDLVEVGPYEYPHAGGMLWAEPRLREAAAQMRDIVARPAERVARAARGAELVRSHHAPAVIGARYRCRLDLLAGWASLDPALSASHQDLQHTKCSAKIE